MKGLLMLATFTGLLYLGVWEFTTFREDIAIEAQRDKPVEAEVASACEGGGRVIKLTEAQSLAAGITIVTAAESQIPDNALVWFDGKSFVYLETEPLHFRRMEVQVQEFRNGYWIVAGLPAQASIVTTGAQLLLSEDQGAPGEEGEEDE